MLVSCYVGSLEDQPVFLVIELSLQALKSSIKSLKSEDGFERPSFHDCSSSFGGIK